MKREPQRTCIGCRQVAPRARLTRLVRRADGLVWVDRTGTEPGRGAYVCAQPRCVEAALKGGRLVRAFRAKADASSEVVELASDRMRAAQGR